MPKEICTDVIKEYPSLKIANECQYIPRQTCSPDDVQPKELTKPVIKKVGFWYSVAFLVALIQPYYSIYLKGDSFEKIYDCSVQFIPFLVFWSK